MCASEKTALDTLWMNWCAMERANPDACGSPSWADLEWQTWNGSVPRTFYIVHAPRTRLCVRARKHARKHTHIRRYKPSMRTRARAAKSSHFSHAHSRTERNPRAHEHISKNTRTRTAGRAGTARHPRHRCVYSHARARRVCACTHSVQDTQTSAPPHVHVRAHTRTHSHTRARAGRYDARRLRPRPVHAAPLRGREKSGHPKVRLLSFCHSESMAGHRTQYRCLHRGVLVKRCLGKNLTHAALTGRGLQQLLARLRVTDSGTAPRGLLPLATAPSMDLGVRGSLPLINGG